MARDCNASLGGCHPSAWWRAAGEFVQLNLAVVTVENPGIGKHPHGENSTIFATIRNIGNTAAKNIRVRGSAFVNQESGSTINQSIPTLGRQEVYGLVLKLPLTFEVIMREEPTIAFLIEIEYADIKGKGHRQSYQAIYEYSLPSFRYL